MKTTLTVRIAIMLITLQIVRITFPCHLLATPPSNNNCSNAASINISNGGFGLGVYSSMLFDITGATNQSGETFASAISAQGIDQKSMWFVFTLPTTRSVSVSLKQPGAAINSNDAGFAVYRTTSCLPGASSLDTKINPLAHIGSVQNSCLNGGTYYIQVSSKSTASGQLFIELTIAPTSNASYDSTGLAYSFGVLNPGEVFIDYSTGCHSVQDSNELCSGAGPNQNEYNKSAWHTFTTPAYLDFVSVTVSPTNGYYNAGNADIGYKLFQGNCITQSFPTLVPVDGCVMLSYQSGMNFPHRDYKCILQPNTTYSIQLLFHQDFEESVRVTVRETGINYTQAPVPVSTLVPASNNLGMLPYSATGVATTFTDFLACNAQLASPPNQCGTVNPSTGVVGNTPWGPVTYNLNTWFTFELTKDANIQLQITGYHYYLFVRLFKEDISNSCNSLHAVNDLHAEFLTSYSENCIPAGKYSLQILGTDSLTPYMNATVHSGDLGQALNGTIILYDVHSINRFSLNSTGAFDSVNAAGGILQPLQDNVQNYTSMDTFGCSNTLLPAGDLCQVSSQNTKAMYREFVLGDANGDAINDSGMVTISNLSWAFNYRLYAGSAHDMAIAQNKFTYPDTITGLFPVTNCMANYDRVCLIPGTYSLTTLADSAKVGYYDQPYIQFNILNTTHATPSNAEDMGDIIGLLGGSGSITSSVDYFSCHDNAININGMVPCPDAWGNPCTKSIYRQFYLSAAASVTISIPWGYGYAGSLSLFSGQATSGTGGLSAYSDPSGNLFSCTGYLSTFPCYPLPAGWYTVIAYGYGPNYSDPFANNDGYGSNIGNGNAITISIAPALNSPQFNRPYKASVANGGNPLSLGPNSGTTAYPSYCQVYNFDTEYFNCSTDTPFSSHPLTACDPVFNKVAYYVFSLAQESYIHIYNLGGLTAKLFPFDVRTDSMLLTSSVPVQPCVTGDYIQMCKLQPGNYSLLIFAGDAATGISVTPTLYVDQTGTSRFDHANNAYDFGNVSGDSTWYNGKPGDVNPLDPGRAPSHDFIFCTTGSNQDDMNHAGCYLQFNPNISGTTINNHLFDNAGFAPSGLSARRNLWYTFVLNSPGRCRIRVNNVTPTNCQPAYQFPFAVYKSDVSGNMAFSTVVAGGQVDSTEAQGDSLIVSNLGWWCSNYNEIYFDRSDCNGNSPDRYYIVVDNHSSLYPNQQVEVEILFDSISPVSVPFDHYFQSGVIGNNLSNGIYYGTTCSFACATQDVTEPAPYNCSPRSLWYTFTLNNTGYLKLRYDINGIPQNYSASELLLFKETLAGDSTATGLNFISLPGVYYDSAGYYWQYTCISSGTYYLVASGCSFFNEQISPIVWFEMINGDNCQDAVTGLISNPGIVSVTATLDCHTLNNDFGEDGSNLDCLVPAGADLNQFKSTWFKIEVTGNDTLDLAFSLFNNTNGSSSSIHYRIFYGNCSIMTPLACGVSTAVNTPHCLIEGDYYVQVVTAAGISGSVTVTVNATPHADSCAQVTGGNLPVEMLGFSGSAENMFNLLRWHTGSEINNDRFEVQRSSDGKSYETIGTVAGSGNTVTVTEYSFKDMHPKNLLYYYRLKQIDHDGKSAFVAPISIRRNKIHDEIISSVFPIPFEHVIHFQTNKQSEKTAVSITDLYGKSLLQKYFRGGENIFMDLQGLQLSAGIYFMRVVYDDETKEVKKLLKK